MDRGAGLVVAWSLCLVALAGGLSPAASELGDCSQPVSTGSDPVATDCLFILRASVGTETCEPVCVCDAAGGGGATATDALACLRAATGLPQDLECGCPTTTTTSTTTTSTVPSTTLPPTTTTTLQSSTTTTLPPSTTTTTPTSTTSTTNTTLLSCDSGGFALEGSCWYIGSAQDQSCDVICTSLEKTCDEAATRDIAGSAGLLAHCTTLVTALAGEPDTSEDTDFDFCGSADLGIGCATYEIVVPVQLSTAQRVTVPVTTCAADGAGGVCDSSARRICACE